MGEFFLFFSPSGGIRNLGVWFPRGQWGGSPPCARRSWLVMMTPKPRSVFTKGVRTLVPRLTHALTLPVSDVFGLHHYALSLGGRSPRPEWVVRTVPGEGRRVTCLLKSLLGGRTGVPSARSVIPWTLSNHPRTCGLQTRRPGATLLCTRPLHCAQIDRRPLGPSREAGLPVPGASGKK